MNRSVVLSFFALMVSITAPAAFERAEQDVRELAERHKIRLLAAVLPSGKHKAHNITRWVRFGSINDVDKGPELGLLPHGARVENLSFLLNKIFPTTTAEALESHFFPNPDQFAANVVPKNDPISNLNRNRLKTKPEQDKASETLGHIVRVVHDAVLGLLPMDQMEGLLFQAWGHKDHTQLQILKTVSPAVFQKQELMRALVRAYDHIQEQVMGMDEEDHSVEALKIKEAMGQKSNPLSASINHFLPRLFAEKEVDAPVLVRGDIEEWVAGNESGAYKIQEEQLKRLRKRHIIHLILDQVQQEKKDRKNPNHSPLLNMLMTFFWKTSKPDALEPFYKGFFKEVPLGLDKDALEAWKIPVSRDILKLQLEAVEKDPALFWKMPLHQQVFLLMFEESKRLFRFPGMGVANLPDGKNFSDCVETALRCLFLHILKDPESPDVQYDKLPEGPFHDYFKNYSEEDQRLSGEARDQWALLMTQVPGAKFLDEGYELQPSIETIIHVLQFLMGNTDEVVKPWPEDDDKDAVFKSYQTFLAKASDWLSDRLERRVELRHSLWDKTLFRDGPAVTGMVDLYVSRGMDEYVGYVGGINQMLGHGEYKVEDFSNKKSEKESQIPLVVRVWPHARTVSQKGSLIPWMTPELLKDIVEVAPEKAGSKEGVVEEDCAAEGEEGCVEEAAGEQKEDGPARVKKGLSKKKPKPFMGRVLMGKDRLNFIDYPELYPIVLREAVRLDTVSPSLFPPALWTENGVFNQYLLELDKVFENPATPENITRDVLRLIAETSPRVLECHSAYDHESSQFIPTVLDRMITYDMWDVLKKVSSRLHSWPVSNVRSAVWKKSAELSAIMPKVNNVEFHNMDVSLMSEEEKSSFFAGIGNFSKFNAASFMVIGLTAEILDTMRPALSPSLKVLSYSLPHHCPDPQGVEAALEEKWATLQEEGIVSSEAKLVNNSN